MTQQKRIDLTGQHCGRWYVLKSSHLYQHQRLYYLCRCECGTERSVRGDILRYGQSTNCGCVRFETPPARRHGQSGNRSKGKQPTSEYAAWNSMIQRCENPNVKRFKYYGGRGISICERWRSSFENFFADMGPKSTPLHSLDRIDNNGNYEPDNCRWATDIEQRRNRSKRYIHVEARR